MGSNKIIFISYYTKNTIYEEAINKYLLPSLRKFDLEKHIYAIDSKENWRQNAIQKPLILKEALEMFPDYDIIWQDADSEILEYPKLLFELPKSYDIALCYLNWMLHYGKAGMEMLDGTVLWRNTEKNRKFINELISRSTKKGIDHQKTMSKMLEEKEDVCVYPLPRSYSYITSKPNGEKPVIELENPVIVHHQLSREAKRKLNK